MAEGRKKITEEKRGRKATRSKEKNGRNGRKKIENESREEKKEEVKFKREKILKPNEGGKDKI